MAGETIRDVTIRVSIRQEAAELKVPDTRRFQEAIEKVNGAVDKGIRDPLRQTGEQAEKTSRQVEISSIRMAGHFRAAGEGAFQLAKGIAFISAANDDDLKRLIQTIARFEGIFQLYRGGVMVVKELAAAMTLYTQATQGAAVAQTALAGAQAKVTATSLLALGGKALGWAGLLAALGYTGYRLAAGPRETVLSGRKMPDVFGEETRELKEQLDFRLQIAEITGGELDAHAEIVAVLERSKKLWLEIGEAAERVDKFARLEGDATAGIAAWQEANLQREKIVEFTLRTQLELLKQQLPVLERQRATDQARLDVLKQRNQEELAAGDRIAALDPMQQTRFAEVARKAAAGLPLSRREALEIRGEAPLIAAQNLRRFAPPGAIKAAEDLQKAEREAREARGRDVAGVMATPEGRALSRRLSEASDVMQENRDLQVQMTQLIADLIAGVNDLAPRIKKLEDDLRNARLKIK